jgi:glycosyltransferase involved in cell wall biosynthesis
MPLLSVVIPVYHNARSLQALADRLDQVAANRPAYEFEFIYVDDGSGDDSFAVMSELAQHDPRVRAVKLVRNFGSNTAILAGLTYARGDCACFIAADLQDPPETLAEMLDCWAAGYKVVFAERIDRAGDPLLTRLFAGIFNWLFKKLVFSSLSPQGIGFFLIDRQVVQMLVSCNEKNAHLIGLLLWSGYKYAVVSYDRAERDPAHGKSGWTFRKKTKYFIDAFVAFSYLPLRLASLTGLTLAAVGGIYAVILVILRILNEVPVEGWTSMIVVVLITAGLQLVMLGVIGEYLWRNFDASRNRPLFLVDTVVGGSEAAEHAALRQAKDVPGSSDGRQETRV